MKTSILVLTALVLVFTFGLNNTFALEGIKLPSLFNLEESFSLFDLKGKVLLLNFWTIGCPYCKMVLPILDKIQAIFPNDIRVISILYARGKDIDEAKRWIHEKGINKILFLLDEKGIAFKEFDIVGIPHTIFFDCDGKKVTELRGAFSEEFILSVVRKILGK
ncbi:MAG: TlpA family protein disulfide reductase [Synergistetes bacterium]|nr:TlpA family protein disulfide reductase [Synergistota bacterium]